ncbi:MAG TPA: arginine--tRNA ligase [Terriglobia bacterium]|nr:arginine--tRNA ligase [Terriglobia bacterium]
MYLGLQERVREKFVQAVGAVFGLKVAEPSLGYPPSVDLGELSITSCFELAKQLRQPPRKIAEQIVPHLLPLEGVERVSIAGAGYLNFHLDRAAFAAELFRSRTVGAVREPPLQSHIAGGRILVEHTSINPNKAAHIGHLRNAVLGDTFARLLRFRGHEVEIQNYIDNTGVQVADVVVGFVHLEKKSADDVRKLIAESGSGAPRFDYYCWDLYAQVFKLYETDKEALAWRAEALKSIEEGDGDYAAMAELVSTAIVRLHLETMQRVGVRYDLMVQESEILKLDFWKSAFELMKQKAAIRYEELGKNQGCWVMSLDDSGAAEGQSEAGGDGPAPEEDVKVIVRSNGTVTYVGKDIAYHLWKFALLDRDFGYEPFHRYPDDHTVWRTATRTPNPESRVPPFGHASAAYAVIDTRQSYVQNVVAAAFRALGYKDQAANLHHFAYEVVGLSIACATELDLPVGEEEQKRGYVDVSGRKGSGVKADDFIDTLDAKAAAEVRERQVAGDANKRSEYGRQIAVGALRYFLVKFTRRTIIAFDFKEALAFEGETGPYLQYTVVRARNIFRKFQEAHLEPAPPARTGEMLSVDQLRPYLTGDAGRDFWELVLLAAQLEMTVDQAIAAEEPAIVAKYAFRLAQAFNNFYHHYRILGENDQSRQSFLLFVVRLTSETLARTLDLLGIDVPERM